MRSSGNWPTAPFTLALSVLALAVPLAGGARGQPAAAGPAAAAPARPVVGRLGPLGVSVEPVGAGWRLRAGGLEQELGAASAPPRLRTVRVQGGGEVLWIQLPRSPHQARELVLAPGPRGRPGLVLDLISGPEGEDGEQSRHVGLVAGQLWTWASAVQVWRCDRAPVHLLARRLERDRGALRFVPRSWPQDPGPTSAGGGVPILAEPLTAPAGPSLAGFRAVAASSTAGQPQDVSLLRAPAELTDGASGTAWISDGPGRHEWVTLTGDVGSARVTAVVVVPGHAGDAARLKTHARLRAGRLILAAGTVVRFRIGDDPAGRAPGTAYRIRLPRPVASGCVTLQVDEVSGGPRLAIAEVTPQVDVETQGLPGLLADLGKGGDAAHAAARALRRGGPTVARALAGALPRLTADGLRLALGIVTDHPAAAAAPALCQALLAAGQAGAAAGVPELARALRAHGQPAAACLGALLERPELAQSTRLVALELLGTLPGEAAVRALRGRLGGAPRPVRLAVLTAARQQPAASLGPALIEDLDAGSAAARVDRWTLLGQLAAGEPALAAQAAARLLPHLEESTPPEVRLAALAVAGEILAGAGGGAAAARDRLVRLAAGEKSPVIRALAVRSLGRLGSAVLPAILARLEDPDPRVRDLAVEALARAEGVAQGSEGRRRLLATFRAERWPRVRRRIADLLGRLCRPAGGTAVVATGDGSVRQSLLEAFDRRPADAYEVRHATALALQACGEAGLQPRLARLLADPREPIGLREQAVSLYGQLAGAGALEALGQALDRSLNEGRREQGELIAVALARALGHLHDRRAVPYLWRSLIQPSPEVRAALATSLGELCHQASRKALGTLAKDPDLLVKRSAGLALERLGRCKIPGDP